MAALGAEAFEGDADVALGRFDLSVDVVHSSVAEPAVRALNVITEFAPRAFRGQAFHAVATEGFRRFGKGRGWRCDDADGVARLVSRDGRIAVVVATGNQYTGLPGGASMLSTKNPHGSKLLEGGLPIDRLTLDQLHPGAFSLPAPGVTAPTREVWLLLLRRVDGREVRMELSRPGWMDPSGYPCRFADNRILLPPYRPVFSDGVEIDLGDDGIDVPVLDWE